MTSPSPHNEEVDAWLMKIELKREKPKEVISEIKDKEAVVEQAQARGQALPMQEKEDMLKPYYDHLTPTEIKAFRTVITMKWVWNVVYIGRNLGIYDSWEICKEKVDGYNNNYYKGYKNKIEAGVLEWIEAKEVAVMGDRYRPPQLITYTNGAQVGLPATG
ncbi:hypothetical protein D1007_32841 [Hordeum vulgare]|nr:hypothetical protein D1007_32841 [Hordeum vulgare]